MSVEIQAQCNVANGCTFTNTGDEAGSGCATMVVRVPSGQSVRAGRVCSGTLSPNTTSAPVPIAFVDSSPLTACVQQSDCQVNVELSNLQAVGSPIPWLWITLALVIGSSAWVYSDASKRKLADPSPSAWAIRCLALWIVFFPMYLAKRNDPQPQRR